MNALVLGYGNPLRGDDGVGWVVAERLQGMAGITAVPLHQLLPEHADLIHTAVHVIFVDAAVAGEPGAVQVQTLAPDRHGLAASHQMSPGVLLAMAAELYGRCPTAHLITITGQNFAYSETLSPPVQESVYQVVGFLVAQLIGELVSEDANGRI
ncbi:MAG: hydrogenase maturation protease [Chloroflexi bacterium]|nr:hydrogenase maturation protease [Ardenticatenaceae bacterium]MBL1126941.1 hydrogenase maturation protease [Chloroflexota bacterium]NOG32998.1 hydrogenase maturation protease [Chloroflexota bacterium]GIK54703.1 MAG: hydrogenase [Chloroflexota bacterium]